MTNEARLLTRRASRIGALVAVYGFCGGWVVYFISAATGTGGMFPMASGRTRGSPFLEGVKHLHTTGRERSA